MARGSITNLDHTQISPGFSLAVAVTIILLWLVSLVGLFMIDISQISFILVSLGVLLRSYLHTGLFIVTHESIHGLVTKNHSLNRLIGWITSFLYALLSYKVLAKNHRLHHLYPATTKDPDFCEPGSGSFWAWYSTFMKKYQEDEQVWISLIGMAIIFSALAGLQIPVFNLFLFWIIPILISSLQLFTFGIFMPHRQIGGSYRNRHRAKSSNYSIFWSFITCYHFGYHLEHHQYPDLPWYKLPQAHQRQKRYQKYEKHNSIDSSEMKAISSIHKLQM